MSRELTLDEMIVQYKTNFRGALRALAEMLGVEKPKVMEFNFDPIEEDDGRTRLYATHPNDGRRWVFEKAIGWQDLPPGTT